MDLHDDRIDKQHLEKEDEVPGQLISGGFGDSYNLDPAT